jgi:hypothetical protein
MVKYISINILAELSCLLFALFYLNKDKSMWRLMVLFLLIIVSTEITGRQFTLVGISNQWLYNIYLLVEAGFVGFMFYKLLKIRKAWMIAALFLFLVTFVVESYLKGFQHFLSVTNLLSSTLFVIFSLVYFYRLLQDEDHYDLILHPPFWWVTGCLFFYFGGTVCNIFFDYLSILKSSEISYPLRYIIFSLLNFILYSCWSYSFLCRYRQRTSSILSAYPA